MPSNRRAGRRTGNNRRSNNGRQQQHHAPPPHPDPHADTMRMQDALLHMSLPQVQAYFRSQLAAHGTQVTAVNDQDPNGDGDQSRVPSHHAQFYRDMFAVGGDINHHADTGLTTLSEFARLCIMGDAVEVKRKLEAACVGYKAGPPPAALTELLEKRETTQRLSPLLMLVSIAKNLQLPGGGAGGMASFQVDVAKVLLRYGARPDARDFAGKTVCHYGMGMMATMNMTVPIACACSEAHKSCDLYGKQVELHGLEGAVELNGAIGWCRGYLVDEKRRQVYLTDRDKVVSVKRKNIKLAVDAETAAASVETEDDSKTDAWPGWLCDVPDRLGSVCLHELVQTEREDVADLLLKTYVADMEVEDCDGVSPLKMSTVGGAALVNKVAAMITKEAGFRARRAAKVEERMCSNCGVKSDALKFCHVCHSTKYCSKECQIEHWHHGGHKTACRSLAAKRSHAIQLDKPKPSNQYATTFSFSNRAATTTEREGSGYRKPSNVAVGEHFDIKVQGGPPTMPLMIYDKSRECNFTLNPGDRGYAELRKAVNDEPTWQGRKTFVLAEFDADGNCKVYPGCTSSKKW